MCAGCKREHVKCCAKISKPCMEDGRKLFEDLECLSLVISGGGGGKGDTGTAQMLTVVYEDLVSHCLEFVNERDESVCGEMGAELEKLTLMCLKLRCVH